MVIMSDKSSMKLTIRLHKNITAFNEVLKDNILNWKNYTVTKTVYGDGMIYLSPSLRTVPIWSTVVEELADGSNISPEKNTHSNCLMVFKIILKNKDEHFMSLSYGAGDSLIDSQTIVSDFGKVVASKSVEVDNVTALENTQITDIILQSSHQIVGLNMNGAKETLLENRSQYIRKIIGTVNESNTSFRVKGSDAVLQIEKLMKINEIPEELKKQCEIYFSDKKQGDWVTRFSEVKIASTKDTLTDKLIDNILNGENFAIAWPAELNDNANVRIEGLGSKNDYIAVDFAMAFKEYIQLKNLDVKQIKSKLHRDHLVVENDDGTYGGKILIYNALIGEVIDGSKRYELFGGKWYSISPNFYKEIQAEFSEIDESQIKFPTHVQQPKEKIFKDDEGFYNIKLSKRLAKSGIENVLMDKNLYKPSKKIANGSVEVADILTKNKELIHIKKGTSSHMLSHLFLQGELSSILFKEDDQYRKFVNKSSSPKVFIEENENTNNITIVFGIIDRNKNVPFFSMITLVEVFKRIRRMNYKVQIAWIQQINIVKLGKEKQGKLLKKDICYKIKKEPENHHFQVFLQ